MKKPQLWIVAGPNGSGKSTLVARYLRSSLIVVNADNYAKDFNISPVQAGRMAIAKQNELLSAKKNFIIETTLSGKREIPFALAAKDQGYKLRVAFISVRNYRFSQARVSERVAAGGHNVPPEDIKRRFARSLENLPQLLKLADNGYVLDNSRNKNRLLLSLHQGKVKHLSKRLPKWAATALIDIVSTTRTHSIKR